MAFLNTYSGILLYAGLALFIANSVLSIIALKRGAVILNTILILASCILILCGLIGITFPTIHDRTSIYVTLFVAVLGIVVGIGLYIAERQTDGLSVNKSSGLLVIGSGIFALVTALIVPTWPGQFLNPPIVAIPTATIIASRTVPPSRTPLETATITPTPSLTLTVTDLPTLTYTPTDEPLLMPTSVLPSSTPSFTPAPCNVRTTTTVRLRPDPSTRQKEVAIIGPDTLLPVIGLSADRQWWQVVYAEFSAPVTGWVNKDIVTPDANCSTIQPFTITPTLTKTPTITKTPSLTRTSSRTKTPSLTKTPSKTKTPRPTLTPSRTRTVTRTRSPIPTKVP